MPLDRPTPMIDDLRRGQPSVWLRASVSHATSLSGDLAQGDVDEAAQRLERFRPALVRAFREDGWDGRIRSDLYDFVGGSSNVSVLVKGDHLLPLTGSIKARGGIYELLVYIETIAKNAGLLRGDADYAVLATDEARALFGQYRVSVASTGNLGFSIGLAARAFGLRAEIHMSDDATSWKKARLRRIGAEVVEHACDYSETVARARAAAHGVANSHFVDDETSRELMVGYATAAREIAAQIDTRHIHPTVERPLVVYLPCGVGGAPGGITFGLKTIYGASVICVFVEPIASACMLVAMATGAPVDAPPSVYEFGLDNATIADGLAVPRASSLVLKTVGPAIDGIIAVSDTEMKTSVQTAWTQGGLRLEPSAASGLAALPHLLRATSEHRSWPDLRTATHVVWATGGGLLPDEEFDVLLTGSRRQVAIDGRRG